MDPELYYRYKAHKYQTKLEMLIKTNQVGGSAITARFSEKKLAREGLVELEEKLRGIQGGVIPELEKTRRKFRETLPIAEDRSSHKKKIKSLDEMLRFQKNEEKLLKQQILKLKLRKV